MNVKNNSLGQVSLLTGARILGILFSISIPMLLGRHLSVETYGTYKQVMLLFWFSQVALNLGLDDSAYYFVRIDRANFSLYSLNALVINLFLCSLIWLTLIIFKTPIANLLNNPELAVYLPLLGFLILVTVSSMQLEGILLNLNHFKERIFLEISVEVLKSLAIILGFLLHNSIYMAFFYVSLVMSIRLLITIIVILRDKLKNQLKFYHGKQFIKAQLQYGLPLGISRVMQHLLNIENFLVSSMFSLVHFTYYSVGCFENPIVNAAKSSFYEVANIEILDAYKKSHIEAAFYKWLELNRRLSLLVLPFIIYMIFFAKELIYFIFSSKYHESIPYFMVFNIYVFINCLNPEPLFRASNNTQKILKLRIAGLVIGILLMIFLGKLFGPMFVLVGKAIALMLVNLYGIKQGARFLQRTFVEMIDFKLYLKIAFISILTCAPLLLIPKTLSFHPFFILAITFSLFVVLFLCCGLYFKLFKEQEIDYIKSKCQGIFQ